MNDGDLLKIDKFANLDNITIFNNNNNNTQFNFSNENLEQTLNINYENILNKERNMLNNNKKDVFLNSISSDIYNNNDTISLKLFMDCMKMSDQNFKYLNERINNLDDKNRSNINKIAILNKIIKEMFIIQKQNKEDIIQIKINSSDLYKKLLIIYTKYDSDISSAFKNINSNTNILLEEILYNSEINNLLIHNKIDEAQKKYIDHNNRKRKLEESIKIMSDKVDNSKDYPRKSERISKKQKK